ncbi:MAG TPA: hypothetical protein VEL76_34395 [Gemmataceae bacterium]|nr:hypothetical protein [Gemmataceae bacterium]
MLRRRLASLLVAGGLSLVSGCMNLWRPACWAPSTCCPATPCCSSGGGCCPDAVDSYSGPAGPMTEGPMLFPPSAPVMQGMPMAPGLPAVPAVPAVPHGPENGSLPLAPAPRLVPSPAPAPPMAYQP